MSLTYEREGHSAHSKDVIHERKVTINTMNVTVDVLTVRSHRHFRSLRLPTEVDTFAHFRISFRSLRGGLEVGHFRSLRPRVVAKVLSQR